MDLPRRLELACGQAGPEHRDQRGDAGEDLGQPDGDHHDDQARGAPEAAQYPDFQQSARSRSDDEAEEHGQEVVHVQLEHELDGQHRRHRPELGLREVDDPVGPIDEHDSDGNQPVERAEHHPCKTMPTGKPRLIVLSRAAHVATARMASALQVAIRDARSVSTLGLWPPGPAGLGPWPLGPAGPGWWPPGPAGPGRTRVVTRV